MKPLLLDELADELHRLHPQGRLSLQGPISVRGNSLVFRARGDAAQAPGLAIKCCRDTATGLPDVAEAQRQFEALQRVDAAFRTVERRFGVPQPRFFSVRLAAYGMSWVDGEPLTARMGRRHEAASLAPAFEQVGAWLGTLHRIGPVRQGPADLASKVEHMLTMQSQPVDDRRFRHAISALAEATGEETSRPLRISWLHGDCKTDNFMTVGDRIFGIDISLRYENSVEHDIAQFLNNFDLLLTRRRHAHLRSAAPALRRAFMEGYRGTGPAVSTSFLHWIRLWGALTSWHSAIYDRPAAWPKRWLTNRMFSLLITELSAAPTFGRAVPASA